MLLRNPKPGPNPDLALRQQGELGELLELELERRPIDPAALLAQQQAEDAARQLAELVAHLVQVRGRIRGRGRGRGSEPSPSP